MNCLGILNAIHTDIGLQFRGDIMPELPTAPVERLFRIQSHPINDMRRRKQMVWGDIAGCDEKSPTPCFVWFNIVEIVLLAIKPDFNFITGRADVLCNRIIAREVKTFDSGQLCTRTQAVQCLSAFFFSPDN